MEGEIARFTDINMELPWFNIEKLDAADDDEVEQRIKIPHQYKPNYTPFYFTFFAKKHLLVFESYSDRKRLSPGAVRAFLEKLFSEDSIVEKYGEVSVTVQTDKERLREILSLPTLTNVKLVIKRPNPDDWGAFEASVLKELGDQNINEIVSEHRAIKGKSIVLNEYMRKFAKVAANNGKVEVKGRDSEGVSITQSTVDYPRLYTEEYDPDMVTTKQMFNLMAEHFVATE